MALDLAYDSSPIDQNDDVSSSELNVTELSLPESFDDTLFLDLYTNFAETNKNHKSSNLLHPKVVTTNTLIRKTSGTSHEEMEIKIHQLLAENLELKEKSRLCDSLKILYSKRETEIESIPAKFREKVSPCESCDLRGKLFQQQILELRGGNNLTEIDVDHAQNEIELLFNRPQKAEKECKDTVTALEELQKKNANSISRHALEQEELKSRSASDTAVRQEAYQEIVSSRGNQRDSYTRESKLLIDARDYAMEQVKLLQKELGEVRRDKQIKDVETSEIINELEKQLAEVRSDLKVKSCELSAMQASHERLVQDVEHYKQEKEKIMQELSNIQLEYFKLEKELAIERSRFEEIMRNKDEELRMYEHGTFHHRPQEADTDSNIIPERKSLFRLARKCRELQSLLQKSNDDLSAETIKNDILTKQVENNKRLYQELTSQRNKNASEYILSAVNERDKEISCLHMKLHVMYTELNALRKNRDDLASKLAEVLERRERLDDMKTLVEEGMKNMKMLPVVTRRATVFGSSDGSQVENTDESEDLLDHIVYHKKSSGNH